MYINNTKIIIKIYDNFCLAIYIKACPLYVFCF